MAVWLLAAVLAAAGCGGAGEPSAASNPGDLSTGPTTSTSTTVPPTSSPTTTVATTTASSPSTTLATTTTTTAPPPAAGSGLGNGPGRYEVEIASGGLLRRAIVVVPESVAGPAPLVLVFHGFTRSPEEIEETSGMSALAEEHGFVVVYPAGTGFPRRWLSSPAQGDQDVVFVRELVALVSAAVPVDPGRVFAAGMSNGGGMAARLACDAADLVAAVGPVAAAYPSGPCEPVLPVAVVAIHGSADPIVPYEGVGEILPAVEGVVAAWVERNGCAPDPVVGDVAADVGLRSWTGCAANADVVLYRVEGGRHGWPGSGDTSLWGRTTDAVGASALLWEFFAAHPRP